MKKQTLFALLLAVVLLLSGCTLNAVDQEADAKQTILSVNGETVDKKTISNAVAYYQQMYSQYNSFYSQLGMSSQYPTDASTILEMVLDGQKDAMVARQKAVSLGLDQFTEEETATLQEEAEANYQSQLEYIKSSVLVTDKLGSELEEEAKAYADSHGYSLDDFLKDAKEQLLTEKAASYIKDAVTVTDEDVQAALDERVATEKSSYEADLTVFGTNLNNGTTCYYAPAGYRYIKHILIKYTEEDAASVSEANTALTEAQANETTARAALDNAAEDADKAALQTALDEAVAAVASAQEALDAAMTAARENIQAKVDEVYALVTKEGADFDALMAEYGEDDGMKTEPAMTNGYAVCEGFSFVEPFLSEALALEKVGDVSEPVATVYGCHIIQYTGDIAEGVRMTLEEAKASLESTLLSTKQESAYNEALDQWISEADIKSYPEKMGY